MALRCVAALSRLTNGDGAYLVLMLGGARCATDCLKVETS